MRLARANQTGDGVSGGLTIRREFEPGDLGAILAQHGRIYADEFGLDPRFEAMVAASIAEVARRGFPRLRERIWIVADEGEHLGSVALTDERGNEAMLRWVLLDPRLRGQGLGQRLIGEAIASAQTAGYDRLCLETFSELTSAARIYRGYGFEVVSAETKPRWGRSEITYQRYQLDLRELGEIGAPHSARSAVSL